MRIYPYSIFRSSPDSIFYQLCSAFHLFNSSLLHKYGMFFQNVLPYHIRGAWLVNDPDIYLGRWYLIFGLFYVPPYAYISTTCPLFHLVGHLYV